MLFRTARGDRNAPPGTDQLQLDDLAIKVMRPVVPLAWACAIAALIVCNGWLHMPGAWVFWAVSTAFAIWVVVDRP